MKLELYTDAVLTRDLPEEGLCAGDVVKVVDHHPVPGGEDGYSIEVFNAVGDTIAVTTVPESGLEPLAEGGLKPELQTRLHCPGAKDEG